MRIGELATTTGIETQNIRYYEREGLIPKPSRGANGYRAYGELHLERLAFIRHCRALDMSLADIRTLLHFLEHPREDCSDVDRLVEEQLGRVKARLKSMRALERQLVALRAQCAAGRPARKCGILHELLEAAHGEACACHPSAAKGM
jgi:Cd(II)/Pb(II)-responsive transcriptional regulator